MPYRPSEAMKIVAGELADCLFDERDNHVKRDLLLEQLRHSCPIARQEAESVDPKADGSIGIWLPVDGYRYYERDNRLRNEWPMWADVPRISSRSNGQRVVLIGESVARGYLYDPCYTVAQALEYTLNRNRPVKAEVVDLARTGMRVDQLMDTARASIALGPDAVVIFAGNNWGVGLMETLLSNGFEKMVAEEFSGAGLFQGVRRFVEQQLVGLTANCLTTLKKIFVDAGIPVLFVIPGYNLRDWESNDMDRAFPWMPEEDARAWLEAKDSAEDALYRRQADRLRESAAVMVGADPLNPYGHELLAKYHIMTSNREEAIRCLEKARDTCLLPRNKDFKPRCFSVIEETILAMAPECGITTVNLAAILKEVSAAIPGRELFLDHCHLSFEGIRIAASYITGSLIGVLDGKQAPADSIMPPPAPDNHILAVAHLGAAIHGAHFGQKEDLIQYHCEKAISLSGIIRDIIPMYIDFSTRRVDSKFCRTFGEIILSGQMRQYSAGTALAHPRNRKLMDIVLIDVMTGSLSALLEEDISGRVKELRKREHKVGREEVNLLESFYKDEYYADFFIGPDPLLWQARVLSSHFHFIADGGQVLNFSLVYRMPERSGPGAGKVCLNDASNVIAALPITGKWTEVIFTVNSGVVDGVNRIIIEWPYSFRPADLLDAEMLSLALYKMFPVWGEIHQFSVSSPFDESYRQPINMSGVRELII